MKTPTIQEQYNLLKEGKGHKDVFMKTVRSLFPEYVNQYTSFDDTINILKSKNVLSEGIGGLVTTGRKQDWHAIFNENISALKEEKEAKAEEKKPTKDVVDAETKNYNYEDKKNIDNVYGQEFLEGYYAEMKDPKNKDKSVDELKAIVAKNLAKDNQHYIKDGQFGIKGVGYTTEAPGLGTPKEAKGKYKSSGYGNLKESIGNDLEMAKQEAQENSKEGYVQHVNKTENGYEVSDWYDSDDTVYSYEDGKEINNREDMFMDDEFANDLDNYDDDMYNQNYQWDDENPDLRKLGANPKLYESKIRNVISKLIKEELNIKEIEETGEDAKKKAMTKKIDDETIKRKKKLKALTTLTELEKDSVNPKKMKELQAEIKKLEALREKLNKGKKKEMIDEIDPNLQKLNAAEENEEKRLATIKKQQAAQLEKPGTQS